MRSAELKEGLRMALNAVVAHKLRSMLTMLGVLVGVFSITVVMTGVRVLQTKIEAEMSGLGANTFAIQKWPGFYFGGPDGFEKFWRRKNITLADAEKLRDRASLALNVGVDDQFWQGDVGSRFLKSTPNVTLRGASPGAFAARNWIVDEGRPLMEQDMNSARDVAVLGHNLATNLFPFGSALGERLKIDGINYTVVGVLESKGSSLGGDQDKFAITPITTAQNRYGRIWRSLSILVQAPDAASYDDTMEQVRGAMRTIR